MTFLLALVAPPATDLLPPFDQSDHSRDAGKNVESCLGYVEHVCVTPATSFVPALLRRQIKISDDALFVDEHPGHLPLSRVIQNSRVLVGRVA